MKTIGMRHIALKVKDAQLAKKFYCDFLFMSVEWEPDNHNVYLTTDSHDNLALHQEEFLLNSSPQGLDHFGFITLTPQDVDEFYARALQLNVFIAQPPKQHRDGAYSFYCKDPDGYTIQIICHPPIVKKQNDLKLKN